MFLSITVIILTSVSLYMTEIQDCNCIDCKEVTEGEFAGVYILGDDMSHQADCRGEACLYTEQDTGRGLCFCDPGNVTYELCNGYTPSPPTYTDQTPSPNPVPGPSPSRTTKNPTTNTPIIGPSPSPITKTPINKTPSTTTPSTHTQTTNTPIIGPSPSPITATTTATTSTLECTEEWVDQYRGKSGSNHHRIVGGDDVTDPKEWPWMVSLKKPINITHVEQCGGTLITCQHVLTAKHCVVNSNMRIILNTTVWDTPGKVFEHFPPITFADADVAIIQLKKKISRKDVIDGYIRPIMLPARNLTENDTYWVIGYGNNPKINDPLHETDKLKLQADTNCNGAVTPLQPTTDICIKTIGPPPPTVSPVNDCIGDSGGPGMIKDGDRWYIQGVVSRGTITSPTCVDGNPSIHVAVNKEPVLYWIYASIPELD